MLNTFDFKVVELSHRWFFGVEVFSAAVPFLTSREDCVSWPPTLMKKATWQHGGCYLRTLRVVTEGMGRTTVEGRGGSFGEKLVCWTNLAGWLFPRRSRWGRENRKLQLLIRQRWILPSSWLVFLSGLLVLLYPQVSASHIIHHAPSLSLACLDSNKQLKKSAA